MKTKHNPNWGGKREGAGRPRQYLRLPVNHGRGHDKEFAEPQRLSSSHPTDPSDIVLAQNSDGRYGIYLEDDWYGAGQALVILEYLQKHKDWLAEKAKENSEIHH